MRELRVINPWDETIYTAMNCLTWEEADQAIDRARRAYESWRWSTAAERRALCESFTREFEGMADAVAADITGQMGKPLRQARNEVNTMLDRARYMISIAEATLADEYLPEAPGFVRYIRHEPLGVVLDIAAWNYPLLIAVNVVVPAVLAGNAVLIKHSSKTPLCGRAFTEAFRRAGAPEGLVQDLVLDHETTERVIADPRVDFVSFTGSVRGGHDIVRAAADRFIGTGLELGGKDPAYVCADAPFAFTVENTVDGAFYNAGQSCCAIERIYVERSIYREFLDAFVELTRAYRLGDPKDPATTIGPLASKSQPAFLADQVRDAVARGGRLVVDPASFEVPGQGWFFAPAVVADAPHDCSLMREESFGPVIGLLPVSGDEEAIRLMNDSPYGLTASIWTMDPERARRVGERIETGTFYMNRCDYLDPALPWTGVKDTGRGATLSRYGLLQLSRLKSMHLRVKLPGT
ncbi:MAG TPA: aldehyde dehydrogenase family protein [Candidatus Hydrogenedentes bacterium]|nr:aldehyde dehydrogenase family protein [Candidatus Hydrogenedentota bacterium]